MTHTFLKRPELVPVVLTCVIKERIKEIFNRTTSVRKLLLTHGLAPDRWTSKFSEHNISYNLRDSENKLKARIPRTIYFKNSFSYSGATLCNGLSCEARCVESSGSLKREIRKVLWGTAFMKSSNMVYWIWSIFNSLKTFVNSGWIVRD